MSAAPFAMSLAARITRIGILAAALCSASPAAFALSEIQQDAAPQQQPAPDASPTQPPPPPPAVSTPVPLPDPVMTPSEEPAEPEVVPGDGVQDEQADPQSAEPETNPNEPLPEVFYDLSLLPEPVRRMHRLITEACAAGDIEALRPLLGTGNDMTQLSLGGIEGDAVKFLKELSGDGEGHEILAILLEVLDAGYVHLDKGTPEELYVWPYFFAVPLDRLDARQRVELFKIVTAGDYEDMKSYGAYIFYRVGITPEGRWAFFVAGD